MICPGLHCAGCSEGQSAGILGGTVAMLVLADRTVQFVAERIWWIGGTLAACFAVSVAVSMALEAWSGRRGARYAAEHGIVSRADVVAAVLVREVPARVVTEMPAAPRPQITPVIIQNFYGSDAAIAAASLIQASARGEVTPVSSNDDAAAKARADQRQAERDARLATGRAQPLGGDRPQDRQARDSADQN